MHLRLWFPQHWLSPRPQWEQTFDQTTPHCHTLPYRWHCRAQRKHFRANPKENVATHRSTHVRPVKHRQAHRCKHTHLIWPHQSQMVSATPSQQIWHTVILSPAGIPAASLAWSSTGQTPHVYHCTWSWNARHMAESRGSTP